MIVERQKNVVNSNFASVVVTLDRLEWRAELKMKPFIIDVVMCLTKFPNEGNTYLIVLADVNDVELSTKGE
uniref:Uncharacterized protein n=1 Tax=Solanum lycopersicum TaxID=4081 RepID=A0A3Q7FGE9_SOLLC